MSKLRIPFEAAIYEPNLLKDHFWGNKEKKISGLTFPQQTVLMAMYGLDLSNEKDERGFTRKDYFWASQGFGSFDELGFLTAVTHPRPYVPKEYRELWMIAGVRAGKSLIADTATVYEAVCGGHEEYIRKGTRGFSFQIAQDLRSAKKALVTIKSVLDTVPFLTRKNRMSEPTADRIDLWNGITIATMPPTVKAIRGYDSPCSVMDEIGVWPTDKDASNVDNDIYSQVSSRQAQFEHPKVFGLSSPWIMSGMLYENYKAGTNGIKLWCPECELLPKEERDYCDNCNEYRERMKDKLVYHLPTAAFHNPLVKIDWLKAKKASNPRDFRRECLGEFLPSTESFLDSDHLDACVTKGIYERAPVKIEPGKKIFRPFYVAAIDPGFKRDAFGFGIAHIDEDGFTVIDVVRQWKPYKGQPNDPQQILSEITPLMQAYGCYSAMSDQYHYESLQKLAQQMGWSLEPVIFTGQSKNDIFSNLYTLTNLKRLKLLDNHEVLHELKSLQRLLTSSSGIQIGAPTGLHDDLAVIIALLASRTVYLDPTLINPKKPETYEDIIEKQIARRNKTIRLESLW